MTSQASLICSGSVLGMFSYKVFLTFLESWTEQDFLSCKSVFSFTTLLSVLQQQRSTKWKHREDCTFLTLFPCEHPVVPGETLVQQKKKLSRKDVAQFKSSVFCALPFVWVPLSIPHSLPHGLLDPISSVVQTTAGPHINDNPGSYKELCSHIRTSEIKAARRWTPPTAYLGGYYS